MAIPRDRSKRALEKKRHITELNSKRHRLLQEAKANQARLRRSVTSSPPPPPSHFPKPKPEPLPSFFPTLSTAPASSALLRASRARAAASAGESPDEDVKVKLKLKLKIKKEAEEEAQLALRKEREDGLEPVEGEEASSGSEATTAGVDASTAASSPDSEAVDVEEDDKPTLRRGTRARNVTAQPGEGQGRGAPSPSAMPETRSSKKRKGSDGSAIEVKPDIKPKISPEVKAAIKAFKRAEAAVTILDIETWAKLYYPEDPNDLPQPPSDLANLKHFHRDDLRGVRQRTYADPMTEDRPMTNARLTPDPARNFCLNPDASGRPFILFDGDPKPVYPTSVFVDNKKNAKKLDEGQGDGWINMAEKYTLEGTFKNVWAGKLVQTDWDNATMEQRNAFVDCMAAYGDKGSNKDTLGRWGFAPASIEGDLAARKRNIREELDDHAGRVGPTFALFVYTGYDKVELEWVTANRKARRGD